MTSLLCIVSCLFLASYSLTAPTIIEGRAMEVEVHSNHEPRAHIPLRILPLGNSITYGYPSTDGNGYRLNLLNLLATIGASVEYIGSQRRGNMTNNEHEGHVGAKIDDIAKFALSSIFGQPNVILLMAGTNDMIADHNTAGAPERLGNLIDECHLATHSPTGHAVIIVAQLTPTADDEVEARNKIFNAAIPGIVEEKVKWGVKALMVDMNDYISVKDLKDGLHPNDYGYTRMAEAWFDGIKETYDKGWISAPVPALKC